MRVVLDTNVLLMSIPTISDYRPIFQGLMDTLVLIDYVRKKTKERSTFYRLAGKYEALTINN